MLVFIIVYYENLKGFPSLISLQHVQVTFHSKIQKYYIILYLEMHQY